MLQGKFGLAGFDNRDNLPPFVKMAQQETACKCPKGSHSVMVNNLWGDAGGCHCESDVTNLPIRTCPDTAKMMPLAPKGYMYIWNNNICDWQMVVDYNSTGGGVILNPNTPIYTNPSSSDLLTQAKDFFNEHKLLVGAAVLGLGYMVFSGGLAASDRTITSVTRFSPRKKNGTKRRKTRRTKRR